MVIDLLNSGSFFGKETGFSAEFVLESTSFK